MRYFYMINPTYIRVALLAGALLVWALTGLAPDDDGCC
jgi:hypothetical protein